MKSKKASTRRAQNPWTFPANVLRNSQSSTGKRPGRQPDLFDPSTPSSLSQSTLRSSQTAPFEALSPPDRSTPTPRSRPPVASQTTSRPVSYPVPPEFLDEHTRRAALNTQYSDSEEEGSPPKHPPARISRPKDPVRGILGIKVIKGFLRQSSMQRGEYLQRELELASLPLHFDHLPHDYNHHETSAYQHLLIEWLDGPGIHTADIRARHLILHLPPEHFPSENRLVFRFKLKCNGSCDMVYRDKSKTAKNHQDEVRQVGRRIQRSLAAGRRATPPLDRQSESPVESLRRNGDEMDQDESQEDGQGSGAQDAASHGHSTDHDEENDLEIDFQRAQSDEEEKSNDGSSGSEELETRTNTRKRCSVDAQCIVEISTDQLASRKCTMWTLRDDLHQVPRDFRVLKTSKHILSSLFEKYLVFGQTLKRLELWFTQQYSLSDPYCRYLFQNGLEHRLPKAKDYQSLIASFKRRSRLDAHCLAAIEVLVKLNPQAFIHHNVPPIIGDDDYEFDDETRFECIIAPPNGLDVAILWGYPVGISMDSSWRNKNNQRCPLTLVVTIDEFHHMRPIAAMVSLHADTSAYATLLSSLKAAVEARASAILEGIVQPTFPAQYHETIRQNASEISEDGFWPQFVMIDGADPERLAIERVLPGTTIRLCQFHFMQSVSAHLRGIFGVASPESKLKVNQCLKPIRIAQRCQSEEDWNTTLAQLRENIQESAGESDRGREQTDQVMDYLEREWFGDIWRQYCVDYGMPDHLTRDGFASTNNWIEAAFRVIDRIFLNCRANNRLDWLLIILLQSYFPFFANQEPGKARPDPRLVKVLVKGVNLWAVGGIYSIPISQLPVELQSSFSTAYVCLDKNSQNICGYSISERRSCTCEGWRQTGKLCLHLHALSTLELCGPASRAEEEVSQVVSHILPHISSIDTTPTLEDDVSVQYDGLSSLLHPPPNAAPLVPDIDVQECDPSEQPTRRWTSVGIEYIEHTEPSGQSNTPSSQTGNKQTRKRKTPFPNISSTEEETCSTDLPPSSSSRMGPSRRQEKLHSGIRATHPPGKLPSRPSAPFLQPPSDHTGRPPVIKKLHPYRDSSRKQPPVDYTDITYPKSRSQANSTNITFKQQDLPRGGQPIGVGNSGNDCFALSLLQIVLRCPGWMALFRRSFNDEEVESDPILSLVKDFQDVLYGEIGSRRFHHLVTTLKERGIVDPSSNAQCDPLECMDGLFKYLDECLLNKGIPQKFIDYFSPAIQSTQSCTSCRYSSITRSIQSGPVLLHSASIDSPDVNCVLNILESELRSSSSPATTCRRCEQPGSLRQTMGSLLIRNSRGVVFNIVRPLRQLGQGGQAEQTGQGTGTDPLTIIRGRRFSIPVRLDNPHILDQPLNLFGIICHVGRQTAGAHYVTLLLHKDRWWIINDNLVRLVGGPSEAFEAGRYPFALFYLVEGSRDPRSDSPGRSNNPSNGKRSRNPGKASRPDPSKRFKGMMGGPERDRDVSVANQTFFLPIDNSMIVNRLKNESWISRGKQQPLMAVLTQITDHPPPTVLKKVSDWGEAYLPGCSQTDKAQLQGVEIAISLEDLFNQLATEIPLTVRAITSIVRICESMINTKLQTPRPPSGSPRASFCTAIGDKDPQTDNPWKALGVNGEWRQRRWVGLIAIKNLPFSIISIHPTQKLVMVYDTVAGSWDTRSVLKSIEDKLRKRLEWDENHNFATQNDIEGWSVTVTTPESTDLLHWPQCDWEGAGLLCIAGIVLHLQGFEPNWSNIATRRSRSRLTQTDLKNLRRRIGAVVAAIVLKEDVRLEETMMASAEKGDFIKRNPILSSILDFI